MEDTLAAATLAVATLVVATPVLDTCLDTATLEAAATEATVAGIYQAGGTAGIVADTLAEVMEDPTVKEGMQRLDNEIKS